MSEFQDNDFFYFNSIIYSHGGDIYLPISEALSFLQGNFIVILCYMYYVIYTGCLRKFISFHKLISKRIPVQISSHFHSMFLNRSKFDVYVSCFYLYRYRDALHWKRKGILCVGVCSITVKKHCA